MTVVLLANWFPREERARANGYWVLCQPLAIVVSGPLSGWLLDQYNWRIMFIVQGILPIAFAAVWWWAVEDRPGQATWLSSSERQDIEFRLTTAPPMPRRQPETATGAFFATAIFSFSSSWMSPSLAEPMAS